MEKLNFWKSQFFVHTSACSSYNPNKLKISEADYNNGRKCPSCDSHPNIKNKNYFKEMFDDMNQDQIFIIDFLLNERHKRKALERRVRELERIIKKEEEEEIEEAESSQIGQLNKTILGEKSN
jgi:hypothetical protein